MRTPRELVFRMGTWETSTCVETEPEQVLRLLTDPAACERWSPVRFDLERIDGSRLAAGTRARLAGRLAGRAIGFEVKILEADERSLALQASGPFDIAARYEAVPRGARTELRASVSVTSRGGLRGRLLSGAADGMLAAGALDTAMSRIATAAAA
jgi:hypothetical protein